MKKLLIFLIKIYRLSISPFCNNCCRFYPTCSTYALEAIEKHGIFRGLYLTHKRILKCFPWHKGGYDPVP